MAAIPDDLFFATIRELNDAITSREVSAVDVVRAFTARLEKLGPHYNALALPLTPQAIRKAEEVDKEIKRGRLRGPLQGIPWGAKDLLSYAGQPTTWGARPFAGQVFDYHATVVDKLDSVGSIIIGKLAMVELAGGGGYRFASASLTGPGLNPWDRTCWSGGSSSGSAAAVSAGLVTFAIGSETSGSIITPASYCGVTALRPTYGLVSRYGAMALSWTLDKLGPFTRCVEDCGFVLQAIAGKDGKDPGSAGKSFYYTPQYARPMKELKAGYAPVDFTDRAEPETRAAFAAALDALKATGLTLVETQLPQFPYGTILSAIIGAEEGSIFEPLIASGRINELADASQVAGLKAALEVPAKDYLKAMRLRRLIQAEFARVFSEFDILVTPGRLEPASKVSESLDGPPTPPGAPPAPPQPPRGFQGIIQAGNLAGLPALVVPCGFAGKLPVSLQFGGAPFSENTLLAAGRAFESQTDWHKRRPPT